MSEMAYRPLGDSGLVVSALGIGCNAFGRRVDQDGVAALLRGARDHGVTLLDTADIYGGRPGQSEEMLGEALRGQRDEFVVATKFGMDMQGANGEDHGVRGSRRYLRRAVEGSLRRLQTDHIDLYQYHRPDGVTPVAETLEVLTDLVREGKVGYIGCSNVDGWQVADAAWTSSTTGAASFVSVQNEYSLMDRTVEHEVVPACERFGLGLLPYYPLARGLLTGKYQRGQAAPAGSRAAFEGDRTSWLREADWDRVEAYEAFARSRDRSVLEVALGGLAAQPCVASVVAGAVTAEQVGANARAVGWQPSPEDLAELQAI
jgi:aryl-alcohol dehydrogenase-like predicted oxidoreductase